MLKKFRYFDVISEEVRLNIKGDRRYKTTLGGILGLVAIVANVAFVLYFFINFLSRSDTTIISGNLPNQNLTNQFQLPLMARMSDGSGNPLANFETVWNMTGTYWYAPGKSQPMQTSIFKPEVCDLNKHFGNYTDIFKDMSDLSSYWCFDSHWPILGIYGSKDLFSGYMLLAVECRNSTQNNNACKPAAQRDAVLGNSYWDIRSVDVYLDHTQTNPLQYQIYSNRYAVSNTIYKRIWSYMKLGTYNSDFGFIFSEKMAQEYARWDSSSYDFFGIEFKETAFVKGAFASITIINTPTKEYYDRSYIKIQQFLANIGGIMNFVILIAAYINKFTSNKLYQVKLINSAFKNLEEDDPSKSVYMEIMRSNRVENGPSPNSNINLNNLDNSVKNFVNKPGVPMGNNSTIKYFKVDPKGSDKNGNFQTTKTRKFMKIKLEGCFERILPRICFSSTKRKHFDIGLKFVKENLDVLVVSKRLLDVEKMKEDIQTLIKQKNKQLDAEKLMISSNNELNINSKINLNNFK